MANVASLGSSTITSEGMTPFPDSSRVAAEISAALRAQIIGDFSQISDSNRTVLAIYREQAPASYACLPTISGASFIYVTGVPECALLRVTAPEIRRNSGDINIDDSLLDCGLVVSDPVVWRDCYRQRASHQICLD